MAYTEEQKRAYQAGKSFGTAKARGRVKCKNENKSAFRAGVKAGKAEAKAQRNQHRNYNGGF